MIDFLVFFGRFCAFMVKIADRVPEENDENDNFEPENSELKIFESENSELNTSVVVSRDFWEGVLDNETVIASNGETSGVSVRGCSNSGGKSSSSELEVWPISLIAVIVSWIC